MKRRDPITVGVLAALALVAWCGGCSRSAGPAGAASQAGAKYRLAAEPAGARSVMEVRAELEQQQGPAEVVVVGRINGLGQATWDPERAAFMVADASLAVAAEAAQAEHDDTPKHDAEACPFCRVKLKKELAGLALVEVVDAEGAVPAVDARQLLGLQDNQTVVVRGQGEIDALGALVVRASGIYVKP